MGDRVETEESDEELAAAQIAELKEECDKGWFEDFDESKIIEIIGANTIPQNQLCASLFEKEFGESLAGSLKDKCGPRLFYALNALLLTKADFIAMRLHDAMKGWGTNKDILTRLLGGLDGEKMAGVTDAYESKYERPLSHTVSHLLSPSLASFSRLLSPVLAVSCLLFSPSLASFSRLLSPFLAVSCLLFSPSLATFSRLHPASLRYDRPLWSALKAEIDGDFLKAALTWIKVRFLL